MTGLDTSIEAEGIEAEGIEVESKQSRSDYKNTADTKEASARGLSRRGLLSFGTPVSLAAAGSLTLQACGDAGGSNAGSNLLTGQSLSKAPTPVVPPGSKSLAAAPTAEQASRFLSQAAIGYSKADVTSLSTTGFDAWISSQFAMPRPQSFWDFQVVNGYDKEFKAVGFDAMIWSQLMGSNDLLRQRIGLALLDICVVSIYGISGVWKSFVMADYLDRLWDNAFGNYRDILEAVSTSVAMGLYLTFLGSEKANGRGAIPDENFAREVMQLFTIGLSQLNPDGTVVMANSRPVPTYSQADVIQCARVWTGYTHANTDDTNPNRHRLGMIINPASHETGAIAFLGIAIPEGHDGATARKLTLDGLFNHSNTGPFITKQLIKRLVTSNPTPAYVGRVAAVFADNGKRVRGDMKAVIRAILADPEARDDSQVSSRTFGKLRDPAVRLVQWAKAFGVTSPTNLWPFSHTVNSIGTQPGKAPSVFNWYRPGYTVRGAIADGGLVAPEFQITNEPQIIGYVNFMQLVIMRGAGEAQPDYSSLIPLAGDTAALLAELNLVLAANQISAGTIASMKAALDPISVTTSAGQMSRIHNAILLVMASPEYLVLR